MGNGGLVERLDRAATTAPPASPSPALRLVGVARALREVTETTARELGSLSKTLHQGDRAVAKNDNAPHDPSLPQILQHSTVGPSEVTGAKLERARGQALAPVILALALVCVGVLMSASLVDVARVPGLAWLSEQPRPRLSGLAQPAANISATPDATEQARPDASPTPPLSLDELALLERCEQLIGSGNIQGARQELAKAAAAGSVNARFALAETFDPNVLAAWGMRSQVADVGAARALYEQAQSAGDPRAGRRLAALQTDTQ